MADISVLSRLVSGVIRNVDIASNTLVANDVKIGGASGTILTQAILDNLLTMQNGSDFSTGTNSHTHDGRYYTETELGSTADGSSGASLIGVDETPAFTNISGSTVQAIIESIDTALGVATGANTSLSNLTTTSINQDLLPSSAAARSLGTSSLMWNDVYARALRIRMETTNRTVFQAIEGATTAMTAIYGPPSSNIPSNTSVIFNYAHGGNVAFHTNNDSTADANPTGSLYVETGNKTAGTGDSGSQFFRTGTSAGGTRGKFDFQGLEIDVNGMQIKDLAAPTLASDAARLADVQAAQAGQLPKAPSDVVSTSNITLSGEQTIDGVLTSTSRVLVAGQTNSDENGIYVSAAGAWARAADHDGNPDGEIARGNTTLILSGTNNTNAVYILNATDAADPADITPGTESQEWIIYSRAESISASTGLTKSGLDIQMADAAANNGVTVSSGAISVSLSGTPGLEFSSNQLQAQVDTTGGANLASTIDRNANGLAVRVDDTTIEDDGNGATAQLRVKDLGITEGKLANSAVTTDKLGATSVTAAKLGSDVAGDGLQGGNGSAIAVDASAIAGTGLEDDGSENLRIATSAYDGTSITGGGGSAASVQHSPTLLGIEVAGESFTAAGAPWAVRYGNSTLDAPETAGRMYKADPTELSLIKAGGNQDPFYVIGIANPGSDVAVAGNLNVVKHGPITVTSHGFIVGQPVYLDSTGALTSTAPTTSGEAIVKVGMVKDANTIDIQVQVMGVN